jgi:hypothetical protein
MWERALLPVRRAQLDGFFLAPSKLTYHLDLHSSMYLSSLSRTLFL